MRYCSVPVCENIHKGHGFCHKHLRRFSLYGDPLKRKQVPFGSAPVERLIFYGWTVTHTGCWEYNGCKDSKGYAKVPCWGGGRTTAGSRIAYEAWVGGIPEGLVIRHTCDNPPCINPDHLIPGTPRENSGDMVERGRWRGGNRKLTSEQASRIRTRADQGASFTLLAKEFGVSECAVRDIQRRRTWVGPHARSNHDGEEDA